MKKKGFTLAEILGVIVIVGVLIILVVPALMNSFNNKNDKILDAKKKVVTQAANLFIDNQPDIYPIIANNAYCILLDQLKAEGYIKEIIDSDIKPYVLVTIAENNTKKYDFNDTECESLLNGNPSINVTPKVWSHSKKVTINFPAKKASEKWEYKIVEYGQEEDSVPWIEAGNTQNQTIEFGNNAPTYKNQGETPYRVYTKVGSRTEDETVTKIDYTKPVVSLNPNTQTTYTKAKAVTVTLTDNASGIASGQKLYYAWSQSNSSAPSSYNNVQMTNQKGAKTVNVTIPPSASNSLNGDYYLWIKAGVKDEAGNKSNSITSEVFKFDNTAPSIPTVNLYKWKNINTRPTSESGLANYTNNTWYSGKVFTKATSTDNLTSITYYYTTTGTTANETDKNSQTRNIEAEGQSQIKYKACDAANNCSDYTTLNKILLDRTAPSIPTTNMYKWKDIDTKPTVETGLGAYTNNTWLNGKVFTKATSTDNLTSITYYYTTTGATSNETDYKSQIRNVEANGTSQIKYKACDAANNCSTYSENKTILLDRAKPTCDGASGGKTNWTKNQNVTVGAKCKDSLSGCEKSPFNTTISGQGTTQSKTITIKDKVGNTNTCTYTFNKYIDTTTPTYSQFEEVAKSGQTGSVTGEKNTSNWNSKRFGFHIKDSGGSGFDRSNSYVTVWRSYNADDCSAVSEFEFKKYYASNGGTDQLVYSHAACGCCNRRVRYQLTKLCDRAGNCASASSKYTTYTNQGE